MTNSFFLIVIFLLFSCAKNKEQQHPVNGKITTKTITKKYDEKYRSQFHFTPPEKWMNDPNGLVFHKDFYHLFYQYYPEDIVWGPMHWGHAVSKDMISWQHKPIALYPDKNGLIFSGSAVVDTKNTSGLGSKENPPLVAIFTYHLMEGEKAGRTDYQTQGIAYSLDNGDTWKKYEGNPVIGNDGSMKDFRDPKVFWHDESNQWLMVLVAGDHAKFYSSPNLKDWTLTGEFGKENGAHGGVWECPDLFKLKVEGTDEEKWVLLISINPGAPNGGSGTQYFIGDFDGKTFTVEHTDEKWLDYGSDNYAGVTYNNVPNGDRIFIGWMSNWNYARDTPTQVWRSAMTLPRKLSLAKEDSTFYLKSNILGVFDRYIEKTKNEDRIDLSEEYLLKDQNLNTSEVRFTANLSKDLKLSFTNKTDTLHFYIDSRNEQMLLDKMSSGKVDFEESFANKQHEMPFKPEDRTVDIRIVLDWSSIEIFVDDGRYVMTEQVFPNEHYNGLSITSKDKSVIQNFQLNRIKSVWNEK